MEIVMKKILMVLLFGVVLYSGRMYLMADNAGDARKVKALVGQVITQADVEAYVQQDMGDTRPLADGAQQVADGAQRDQKKTAHSTQSNADRSYAIA
jgi:hypothetical protein